MTASIRSISGAPHARILGIGAYRPTHVVTNEDICRRLDSSDEWIQARTGIRTRRFAGPAETVLEMARAAAEKALAHSGVAPTQIGCVLVATVTHLEQLPAIAPRIAHALGTDGAAAFDLAAACAGFCYGLAQAVALVRDGSAEYVLVIGVEKLSAFTDPTDRSTAFIFGDGAGAVVVGPSQVPAIGPVVWGSDGSGWELISMTHPWDRLREDPGAGLATVRVQGQEVFRWASFTMAPVARQALAKAGVAIEDLDAFIPHQANLRITEAMARALKLPGHVAVARDIVDMGNTS